MGLLCQSENILSRLLPPLTFHPLNRVSEEALEHLENSLRKMGPQR